MSDRTMAVNAVPDHTFIAVRGSALDGVTGILGVYTTENLARMAVIDIHEDDDREGWLEDFYGIQVWETNSGTVVETKILFDHTIDPDDPYHDEVLCQTDEDGHAA